MELTVTERPYSERRELLDSLDLNSSLWRTCETFSESRNLLKNPHYWRWDAEREAMARKHKRRSPAHI
jgi:hypothetical protein